jgi:hypothetical protein
MNLDTVAWIIGTDLGLVSIATIFASAWVRVSRIDKLESSVEELQKKFNRIDVLESKIESIEDGIAEIKELLKGMK